jgi:glycosyltransferase involved in cell wall biosynthesis
MQKNVEMIYLESADNPLPAEEKIYKIRQSFNFPIFNKTLSWYFYFPKRIPEGYELYHVSSQYLAKVADYRRPCVITHMDLAPVLFPREYPVLLGRALKNVLKYYAKAEIILTISEKAKAELVSYSRLPEDRIKVVVPGFDENVYRPLSREEARKTLDLPQDKKIVLHVGSEEKRKNVPMLLRVFKRLQEMIPDAMLIRLGGEDPANKGLKEKLNIRQYHNIPEEKMPLFYNAADVFAFPATYEGGFAYPPLEAMACGTPTVVSEELELFSRGAVIVPSHDEEKLIITLKEILSQPKLQNRLSRDAIKEANRYTVSKQASKTYGIYEEIVY